MTLGRKVYSLPTVGSWSMQFSIAKSVLGEFASDLFAGDIEVDLIELTKLSRRCKNIGERESILDKDNQVRQRYRWEGIHNHFSYKIFGPMWSRGLNLYYELLPANVKIGFKKLIYKLIHYPMSDDDILLIMKEISRVANKQAESFNVNWIYYIGISTLGGYVAKPNDEDIKKGVINWLDWEDNDESRVGKHDKFLYDYYNFRIRYWSKRFYMGQESWNYFPSLKQYTEDPGWWATTGAAGEKRTKIIDENGKIKFAPGTKANLGWSIPPEEIMRRMKDLGAFKLRAFVKRETQKARLVVGVDLRSAWRQSLILIWLMNRCRGSSNSTVFQSSASLAQFLDLFVKRTRGHVVNVPFDWPAFDHFVRYWEILVQFVVMKELLVEERGESGSERYDKMNDLLKVIQWEYLALLRNQGKHKVFFEDGKRFICHWKNGLISGMGLTSIIGSAINWARVRAIADVSERFWHVRVNLFEPISTHGDDLMASMMELRSSLAFLLVLRWLIGMDFNAKKFFIAVFRHDYLRRFSLNGIRVVGPPARIINALLWRNPASSPPLKGWIRASEQLASWTKAQGRGLIIGDHVVRDIAQANGWSGHKVKLWLKTPASIAGGGLWMPDGEGAIIQQAGRMTVGKVISDSSGLKRLMNQAIKLGLEPMSVDMAYLSRMTYGHDKVVGQGNLIEVNVPKVAGDMLISRLGPIPIKDYITIQPTINKAIDLELLRDWSKANEYLQAYNYRAWSDIRKRCSISVFREIWRSSVGLGSIALGIGWNELILSVWHKKIINYQLSSLFTKKRVDFNDLIITWLVAEATLWKIKDYFPYIIQP